MHLSNKPVKKLQYLAHFSSAPTTSTAMYLFYNIPFNNYVTAILTMGKKFFLMETCLQEISRGETIDKKSIMTYCYSIIIQVCTECKKAERHLVQSREREEATKVPGE